MLGCTHFPVLSEAIQNVVGPEVAVIDSAVTTAQEVRHLLRERGLLRDAKTGGAPNFYATDGQERFARVGSIFLGRELASGDVTLVDL